jgi:hypothetical protein
VLRSMFAGVERPMILASVRSVSSVAMTAPING